MPLPDDDSDLENGLGRHHDMRSGDIESEKRLRLATRKKYETLIFGPGYTNESLDGSFLREEMPAVDGVAGETVILLLEKYRPDVVTILLDGEEGPYSRLRHAVSSSLKALRMGKKLTR